MSTVRILLTNDDGWDAHGLKMLKNHSSSLGSIAVLAPMEPFSYCGHRVTTDRDLALTETAANEFALGGTPADCVRVGLRGLFPGEKMDWVLSGINRGGNLGADVYISGTVAAAREAAFLGVPAIAISQYIRRDRVLDWERSGAQALTVIEELMAKGCEPKTFWNVNLPHLEPGEVAPVVYCEPDDEPLDVRFDREGDVFRYSGSYQGRPRTPGRDVALCFGGAITVSKLRL